MKKTVAQKLVERFRAAFPDTAKQWEGTRTGPTLEDIMEAAVYYRAPESAPRPAIVVEAKPAAWHTDPERTVAKPRADGRFAVKWEGETLPPARVQSMSRVTEKRLGELCT